MNVNVTKDNNFQNITPDQLLIRSKYSHRFDFPGSLRLLLDTIGKDIQNAITHKIHEKKLRPNVLLVIKRLMKK